MLQTMMRDFAARVVRPDGRPLMPYDWVCLNSNDRVCVQRENENLVNGTVDVVAGLAALGLGLICAFCGARLAYLNAEQV